MSQTTTIPESLHIGSRIQVGKDRATIRFIGTVNNTKGDWLGVEWDDPHRGKHNGTHQDVKYFSCRYPTSGSFIRFHPEKVNTGTTFMNALEERYLIKDDIATIHEKNYDKSKDVGELYFGGNKQIVVETYGFDKIQKAQRQLNNLKVVGLAEQLISSAGTSIRDAHLTIEDLDLSRNLISNWETASDIVSQLPQLTTLRLNQSRLACPPVDLQPFLITTLSLNQTLIPWQHIDILSKALPQLQDLQLGGNELSQLGEMKFPKLTCLNLEDNVINDWSSEINKLSDSLPSLEILYLNDNRIKSIEITTNKMFPNLRFLRIERNSIDNWNSLNDLNKLPNLTKLRCKENTIFKGLDKELEAAQIVGRIKNLSNVNGNTLTNRERIDLERYYIKSCTKDGSTHEEIAAIHPRYNELCAEHGQPDLQSAISHTSTALKDRLISITLSTRNIASVDEIMLITQKKDLPPTCTSISKKFLRTMTIRNVKHMIQKLLKIPAAKQQLLLLQPMEENNSERDIMIMDITDDLRDLKFYGINSGDELLVIVNDS
ncbi:tubulin-specific chaperone E [Mucor ambiguus]|uniref:Tubulin-specific chaperone E n=1 Tax=Mucor ambiguus TaxID=91626 RepID=A0A0C9M129_9FUNG|nr:tubulin-specific chaperone E [Mucor ambiguus]